jgi:cell filamentation protein
VPEDPYTDPVTGVLRNKLGLRTAEELQTAEREITHAALIFLKESPVPAGYDLRHLCAIHRRIFGDIYDWAGQLRTVAIAKGSWFCLPQYIESSAEEIFLAPHGESLLRGLPRDVFTERLTYYLGEVNAVHPFREATAGPSAPSSSSSPATPASSSTGSAWMPTVMSRRPPPSCTGTRLRCGRCSTNSSKSRDRSRGSKDNAPAGSSR